MARGLLWQGMVRRLWVILGMAAALAIAGCAGTPDAAAWIHAHGGVQSTDDPRQARAESLARPLFAGCDGRRLTIQVLASPAVTAYSLADGHVFVTRGLMDRLSDPLAQAAIAHELGHLLSDGRVESVSSLRGCADGADREVRADAAGAALLKSRGLRAEAMVEMLKQIRTCGCTTRASQFAVGQRIAALSDWLRPARTGAALPR